MIRSLLAVKGIEKLDVEEWRVIYECAETLRIEADWLACIIAFETGGSFSPSQPNKWAYLNAKNKQIPYVGAMGLIQFMPSTAKRLGTSTDDLSKMTFSEQMVYVYRYFKSFSALTSLEDCYLAVFYPVAISKPDDFVIGSRNGTDWQKAVYEQNKGFDVNKDGTVRRGEIVSVIRKIHDDAGDRRITWTTEEDEDTRVTNLFDMVRLAREDDEKSRET